MEQLKCTEPFGKFIEILSSNSEFPVEMQQKVNKFIENIILNGNKPMESLDEAIELCSECNGGCEECITNNK